MLATLEAKLLAAVAGFLVIAAILFAAYHYGTKVQGTKDALQLAQIRAAQSKSIISAQQANDALVTQLEVKNEQIEGALNILGADNFTHSVRLPACHGADQAKPSSGSVSAHASSGVLPVSAESILGEDRQRTWDIEVAAEKELAECRVSQEWACKQR